MAYLFHKQFLHIRNLIDTLTLSAELQPLSETSFFTDFKLEIGRYLNQRQRYLEL